jgi:hypothetical protein
MQGIPDYSESLMALVRLERQTHEAMLTGDTATALKLSEDIMFAARQLRLWLLDAQERS